MVTGASDTNIGLLSCSKAVDQDLAVGHSPGSDISLDSGGQLAIPICLLAPRYPHLSRSVSFPSPQTILTLPLSHLPTLYSFITVVSDHPAPGLWVGLQVAQVGYSSPQSQGMVQSCYLLWITWRNSNPLTCIFKMSIFPIWLIGLQVG